MLNADNLNLLGGTLAEINRLTAEQKRAIYTKLIPPQLIQRFHLSPSLMDAEGHDLFVLNAVTGTAFVELALFHQWDAKDPLFYAQLADTVNGQLHILFFAINDVTSQRFDVDKMPDGTITNYGMHCRNIEAEVAAMRAGLAPAQIYRGLRMLPHSLVNFETFVESLGQEVFFAEPLHYHNAVIFERYGLGYERGRKLIERIHQGFSEDGDLKEKLDGSTPFRAPNADRSLRLRSWAVYDGILGHTFQDVVMYKLVGKHSHSYTCNHDQLMW